MKITKKQKGLTLIEMVIALTIMVVIMAALLPQIAAINKSWDSRQKGSEALQNGRVLVDHINRNLAKAVRIVDASEPAAVNGFLEFEDNNGDTYRYEVSAGNVVQYGLVGSLSDLAGPVSNFQLTCYDDDDLDTSLVIATDGVKGIRFVKVAITMTNFAERGQDKNFIASAYLRSNVSTGGTPGEVTLGTQNSLSVPMGPNYIPGLCRIDATHFLWSNGYENDYILYANSDTDNIAILSNYDHDGDRRPMPAYFLIDSDHVLKASCRGIWPGYASVLTINADWTITENPGIEFDTNKGHWTSLAKIDSNNYLCLYAGPSADGFATVLTVNPADWSVTSGPKLEFAPALGECTSIRKIDDQHYLCAFKGSGGRGNVFVMTVDSGTYALTANTISIAYSSSLVGGRSDIYRIDSNHFIVQYSPSGADRTDAVILRVDLATWIVSATAPYMIAPYGYRNAVMGQYSNVDYVCLFSENSSTGIYAVGVTVDTSTWTITTGAPTLVDGSDRFVDDPVMVQMDQTNVLCVYPGESDSHALIINSDSTLIP